MSANGFGYRIDYHLPTRRYMLYVDAGRDPNDGALLTAARPASDYEVLLWQRGQHERLTEYLRQQGIPLRGSQVIRAGRLRRWLRRVFGFR